MALGIWWGSSLVVLIGSVSGNVYLYEAQGPTIALLVQSARLAPGLSEKEARDIFWTLTARDIYRMLAIERQWSSDRYEKWLGDALVSILVTKKPSRKKR